MKSIPTDIDRMRLKDMPASGPQCEPEKKGRKTRINEPEIGASPNIFCKLRVRRSSDRHRLFIFFFVTIEVPLFNIPTGGSSFFPFFFFDVPIQVVLHFRPVPSERPLPGVKIRYGEAKKPDAIVHQQHKQYPPYPDFAAIFDFEIKGPRPFEFYHRHQIKNDDWHGSRHQVPSIFQGAFREALKLRNFIIFSHEIITRSDCVMVNTQTKPEFPTPSVVRDLK